LLSVRSGPFQGYLKQIKIGDYVTYNLEFKLPSISEYFHLLIHPKALDINYNTAAHSKIHQATLKPNKSKVPLKKRIQSYFGCGTKAVRGSTSLLPSLARVKGASGCAV
jgi:hypothetical protein